jgi:hypothetical protein
MAGLAVARQLMIDMFTYIYINIYLLKYITIISVIIIANHHHHQQQQHHHHHSIIIIITNPLVTIIV